MDEFVDISKAALILVLAIGVMITAFYAFTVVIPLLMVMAVIYGVAMIIKDDRDRY